MQKQSLHTTPEDVKSLFISDKKLEILWDGLTPLGRNEFICWITSAKKPETREKRKKRMCEELVEGKRRPCCWAGCPHR